MNLNLNGRKLVSKSFFVFFLISIVFFASIEASSMRISITKADTSYNHKGKDSVDFFEPILENCSIVSQYNDNIGPPIDSIIIDNIAYLISDYGLMTVDISSNINPVFLDTYYRNPMRAIEIANGYAYIANFLGGMTILDISNPEDIQFVSNLILEGFVVDIAIENNLAYVTDSSAGLIIADISDPNSPSRVGNYSDDLYDCVAVSDSIVYLGTANKKSIQVVDASNPSNPTNISLFDVVDNVEDIEISGDFAFLANLNSGLKILNITNPDNLSIAGQYTNSEVVIDIEISGNFVTLALVSGGFQIVNVTNLASIEFIGEYIRGFQTIGIAYENSRVILANSYNMFSVIDIANMESPNLDYDLVYGGLTTDVAVRDNYAYFSDGFEGFQVYDITNMDSPNCLGKSDETLVNGYGDIILYEQYAYIASGANGVPIFSLTNPTHPYAIDTICMNAQQLCLLDEYLFVTSNIEMEIYDLENPTAPTLVGTYSNISVLSFVKDVFVKGDFVFAATSGYGVHVIDVSDKSNPFHVLDFASNDYIHSIFVKDNLAFVAGQEYIKIYDITDILLPELIGEYEFKSTKNEIVVKSTMAFVTCSYSGLLVLDISDPTTPKKLVHFYDGGHSHGLTFKDKNVLLANGISGFTIITSTLFPTFTEETEKGGLSSTPIIVFLSISIIAIIHKKRKNR